LTGGIGGFDSLILVPNTTHLTVALSIPESQAPIRQSRQKIEAITTGFLRFKGTVSYETGLILIRTSDAFLNLKKMFNVLSLYVNYRLQNDTETVESGLSRAVMRVSIEKGR
jgi:hypothetical protein